MQQIIITNTFINEHCLHQSPDNSFQYIGVPMHCAVFLPTSITEMDKVGIWKISTVLHENVGTLTLDSPWWFQ